MKTKYEIWIWDADKKQWEDYGEGPLTQKQAERIVKEHRADFPSYKARACPVGVEPRFSPTINGIQYS